MKWFYVMSKLVRRKLRTGTLDAIVLEATRDATCGNGIGISFLPVQGKINKVKEKRKQPTAHAKKRNGVSQWPNCGRL
jgi:hypothetical protein